MLPWIKNRRVSGDLGDTTASAATLVKIHCFYRSLMAEAGRSGAAHPELIRLYEDFAHLCSKNYNGRSARLREACYVII
jgi:regulator of replication initiation timing